MERMMERVCGLDVHKQTVAACVRVPGSKGARAQHVRIFGTMAAEVLALRDWLEAPASPRLAMGHAHAAHGPLLLDANEPTATGYEVWAVCVCGAITRSGPHRTGGRASG